MTRKILFDGSEGKWRHISSVHARTNFCILILHIVFKFIFCSLVVAWLCISACVRKHRASLMTQNHTGMQQASRSFGLCVTHVTALRSIAGLWSSSVSSTWTSVPQRYIKVAYSKRCSKSHYNILHRAIYSYRNCCVNIISELESVCCIRHS